MITLHIQVKANSKQNELLKTANGKILVKIKAPAINGKANKELITFFSEKLNIAPSRIVIAKGLNAPFKTLVIKADESLLALLF